ncbi:hypothetical protein ACO22_06455 [Paracoccidioides brasiliensis]|uniref:Myb-like domain-containing protein n=1 Tax=Paracoccidioides brasiliensis TaxID=121759 RepID=A0A1D2J7E3_PARBR|nr:hypothetical protein ACO22_06455 [Paracoccidioides brasiliensis]
MALSRRLTYLDGFTGHDQLQISRWGPTPNISTTQGKWHVKVPPQIPQREDDFGPHQQFLIPANKPEIFDSSSVMTTGFKILGRKCDPGESIEPQNQRHWFSHNVETRLGDLQGSAITSETNTGWESLADYNPGTQLSSFGLPAVLPKKSGSNYSNVPIAEQSLMKTPFQWIAPNNSAHPGMRTTEIQHHNPRLGPQKQTITNCHNSWQANKRARSVTVEEGLHQKGDMHSGWSEPLDGRACMVLTCATDTKVSSACSAATEWIEQICSRDIVPNFDKGAQNFVQQPQRWTGNTDHCSFRPMATHNSLSIAQEDWCEWHTAPLNHQRSPDSSFSSCFTPDTTHEALNFDSPSFHDVNAPFEYFDLNSTQEKQPRCHDHFSEVESFETATTKQLGKLRRMKTSENRTTTAKVGPQRSSAKDEFLVQGKRSGMSYKEIKEKGNFSEAESTLRGRFRTLTKKKEQRVRKPGWQENDLRLLCEAVRKYATPIRNIPGDEIRSPKISWKQVGEHIWRNGGSYHFGNATCKKKWSQIQQGMIVLSPERQFG